METLGPLLLAYAVGCISFASLAGRLKGVDVRAHGSGNPGATNVGRLLGRGWGLAVLVADILKGALPVFLLRIPASEWDPPGRFALVLAVVLGHVWPATAGFRGGKGVATLVGATLALDWRLALGAVLVHALVKRASGYVSLASVAFAASLPLLLVAGRCAGLPLALPAGADARASWSGGLWLASALAVLVTLRHAANLGRIRAGTEPRAGQRSPLERK